MYFSRNVFKMRKISKDLSHELGMKRTLKKKRVPPASGLNVNEDILFKVGRAPTK
jgi:hypothetical protein